MTPSVKTTPASRRELRNLGMRLKEARLRRRMSAELVAERAGTSRPTLQRVEEGDPNVRVGIYVIVMQALGLLKGFGDIKDPLGEQLALEQLPKRVRDHE